MSIGGRIRALREGRKKSLSTLAKRAGISKGLLSSIESGRDSNPCVKTLYKLARALEVTMADLFQR